MEACVSSVQTFAKLSLVWISFLGEMIGEPTPNGYRAALDGKIDPNNLILIFMEDLRIRVEDALTSDSQSKLNIELVLIVKSTYEPRIVSHINITGSEI